MPEKKPTDKVMMAITAVRKFLGNFKGDGVLILLGFIHNIHDFPAAGLIDFGKDGSLTLKNFKKHIAGFEMFHVAFFTKLGDGLF